MEYEPETLTLVYTVKPGDVIRSPDFENLLYKDLVDHDPMCGFLVNPYKYIKSWNNLASAILENPGKMKRANAVPLKENRFIDYKIKIDPTREFVVIHVYRNTEFPKEQISADEIGGRYPLGVLAKMLAPDGEYDPDGILIHFNMESHRAKHAVPEVIHTGWMKIDFKRII